ncbi:MAG TPA: glycoside hydrolase family 3 N-terminal domain-containing protein [Acidobacteriota bacterium]|jgi:beta-N-acetylhexosaminidase|nr:glycoside hydrolase family 3 N-terminal domain-containing protein [Acidobacteriota bacterium]
MNSISSEALAGQCLILGFDGAQLDRPTADALSDIRPAGVILFARNIQARPQVQELMQSLHEICAPRLVCVDQEGGRVDRLRAVFPLFPSAERLELAGQQRLLKDYGRLTGQILNAFGFNVNFAPVLDLRYHDEDNALGTRYLGRDPMRVSESAREYLRGLQGNGITGCGKHFPGLGRAQLDSHFRLPEINASCEELWGEDLIPYRRLGDQLKMVMVSHAAYPRLRGNKRAVCEADRSDNSPPAPAAETRGSTSTKTIPASCDAEIYRILRDDIDFKGIALTDDLDMRAVHESMPAEKIPICCLEAGADFLVVGKNLDFAQLCRDQLATLFGDPSWREQVRARAKKLAPIPAVPQTDLEKIAELEEAFKEWKNQAGLTD